MGLIPAITGNEHETIEHLLYDCPSLEVLIVRIFGHSECSNDSRYEKTILSFSRLRIFSTFLANAGHRICSIDSSLLLQFTLIKFKFYSRPQVERYFSLTASYLVASKFILSYKKSLNCCH